MLIKTIVILIFVVILASLAKALFHLVRYQSASPKIVRALTLRIALSLGLFVLLLVFYRLGWIQPHGLKPNTLPTNTSPNPTTDAAP